jgi:regulator of protease activity HflC (stomatin/prohibitin superfamily)
VRGIDCSWASVQKFISWCSDSKALSNKKFTHVITQEPFMKFKFKSITLALGRIFRGTQQTAAALAGEAVEKTAGTAQGLKRHRGLVAGLLVVGAVGYGLYRNPPMHTVDRGEVAVRINQLTGSSSEWREGSVLVLPIVHDLRRFSLRDQIYRPAATDREDGLTSFQSIEGLTLGVDLALRYALDPEKITTLSKDMPEDLGKEIVGPVVQGVIYKVFTRYTVREIFSTKRAEIQQQIEAELKPKLAADGILMRSVQIGRIDLPADYKRGMENLLAEELASEKMRYTLELKEKEVKQTSLEADAAKIRREKAAEAAASEQIIAAKAQEEAMKHVLPFKQKQIEQRQFEAEASRVAQVKAAEGTSQARRIEAAGEAESRQKLADAEVYRLDRVGRVTSEQMAREGALITKHPLLIQKTMADKLSDKISVIIAPPPSNGDFIGATLLGKTAQAKTEKNEKTGTEE